MSKTGALSNSSSDTNPLNGFAAQASKKKSHTCSFIGRAIGNYCLVGFSTVCAVTFVASIIIGCISAGTPYMPLVCFATAVISLACILISGLSGIAAVISGIVFGVFDSKIKNAGLI